MKKLNSIFILFFVAFSSYAQIDSANNVDCTFFNETINSTNYKQYIDTIGTQEFYELLSDKEQLKFVDCLLSIDSVNPQLNFYKATLTQGRNKKDTAFFKYYRICIDHDFKKGTSYYNMGAFFINKIFSWRNDSLGMFGFSKKEQEMHLYLAERYLWSSYKSGFMEAIFEIGNIQNLKHEYLGTHKPFVNFDQDTLTIVAQILDCGEFGGHIEKIELINDDDIYSAYFFSDSIYCMNEIPRPSNGSKYNGKNVIISKDNLIDFISAINSYEDKGGLTNAPVEIAIISNDQILYQRIQNSRWPHYLEFRRKTFDF